MSATIPLTKGRVAIVDDCDYETLIQIGRWCYSNSGYSVHYFTNAEGQRKTLYLHRMVYYLLQGNQHVPPGMQVDHINHDRLDCRRANLRLSNPCQNQAHKRRPQNNSSGYKGVSYNKGRWEARIRYDGRRINLGRYTDALEAALVYDAATRLLNGDFAGPNFPEEATPSHIEKQMRAMLEKRGVAISHLMLKV